MKPELNTLIKDAVPNQERANELMGNLFDAARPDSIFSEPVVQGDYTVIMASETIGGMGYGFGGGAGYGPEEEGEPESGGGGGGGGGGGSILARPVAAVSIGPDGVRVEPIVDPTKIAIAFFTTLAAIFISLRRISRSVQDLD